MDDVTRTQMRINEFTKKVLAFVVAESGKDGVSPIEVEMSLVGAAVVSHRILIGDDSGEDSMEQAMKAGSIAEKVMDLIDEESRQPDDDEDPDKYAPARNVPTSAAEMFANNENATELYSLLLKTIRRFGPSHYRGAVQAAVGAAITLEAQCQRIDLDQATFGRLSTEVTVNLVNLVHGPDGRGPDASKKVRFSDN